MSSLSRGFCGKHYVRTYPYAEKLLDCKRILWRSENVEGFLVWLHRHFAARDHPDKHRQRNSVEEPRLYVSLFSVCGGLVFIRLASHITLEVLKKLKPQRVHVAWPFLVCRLGHFPCFWFESNLSNRKGLKVATRYKQKCPLCAIEAEYCFVDSRNRKYFNCSSCSYFQISTRAEKLLIETCRDLKSICAAQAPKAPADHLLTILMPSLSETAGVSHHPLSITYVNKSALPLNCE